MCRRAAHEARWAHGYRPGIPVPSYPIDADWLDHLKGTMGNAGSSDVILGADESLWTHYDRHPQQPRPRKVRKCEIESNDLADARRCRQTTQVARESHAVATRGGRRCNRCHRPQRGPGQLCGTGILSCHAARAFLPWRSSMDWTPAWRLHGQAN